jgi:DNA polymerase-3 subunit gamma/tau
LANARAAASARQTGPPAPESTPPTDTWSDGSPTEEPPDEFDGFDPGDEPLDDVIDEKTARRSSEQIAKQVLHDAFAGSEEIGNL